MGRLIRSLAYKLAWVLKKPSIIDRLPHEKMVQEVLTQVKGNLFFDVGANWGFYSILLRDHFEHILAIEPATENIRVITNMVNRCKLFNIKILPLAVSSKDEFITLYQGHHDGGYTMIGKHDPSSMPVMALSMDTLIGIFGAPDLLKIDVESAELHVFAGMKKKFYLVKNILVETHTKSLGIKVEEILNYRGYTLEWLDSPEKEIRHLWATK